MRALWILTKQRPACDQQAGLCTPEGSNQSGLFRLTDRELELYSKGISMSLWLIVLITVLYALTALEKTLSGGWPMGMVFGGYAFANIGLIVMMLPTK